MPARPSEQSSGRTLECVRGGEPLALSMSFEKDALEENVAREGPRQKKRRGNEARA